MSRFLLQKSSQKPLIYEVTACQPEKVADLSFCASLLNGFSKYIRFYLQWKMIQENQNQISSFCDGQHNELGEGETERVQKLHASQNKSCCLELLLCYVLIALCNTLCNKQSMHVHFPFFQQALIRLHQYCSKMNWGMMMAWILGSIKCDSLPKHPHTAALLWHSKFCIHIVLEWNHS